jgi:hypothetical protein
MAEREKDFLLPFFLISQQISGFSIGGRIIGNYLNRTARGSRTDNC